MTRCLELQMVVSFGPMESKKFRVLFRRKKRNFAGFHHFHLAFHKRDRAGGSGHAVKVLVKKNDSQRDFA
jgi:hypothetical protein